MKAYRVRGVGEVEACLYWKGMDGVAYVPVGGSNRSYVKVSPKLATNSQSEGSVFEVDFKLDGEGGMELVSPPEVADPDGSRERSALVVIPTGGFEFHFGFQQLAVNPRCGNACRVVVLQPGEEIRAFPKVRTHAEAQNAKLLALRYDGKEVTFQVA
jgi:hypothetical protein